MTKEELAEKLNGREYREEITKEEAAQAKANGLLVVFGASDDLLEFRGAIDDECGAYEGTTVYFDAEGIIPSREEINLNDLSNEDLKKYLQRVEATSKVKAIWDKDGYSWVIESDIPFAPFDVVEGADKYCRAIVLEIPRSA